MKNSIIKIFLAVTIAYSYSFSQSRPVELKNFKQILSALSQGYDIACYIDYSKCKLIIDSTESTPPQAIGGMKINAWEYFDKGVIGNDFAVIICSETVLISHWKRGYVYNYAKLRIYENGTFELNARYINPKTFETEMNETFHGIYSGEKSRINAKFFAK